MRICWLLLLSVVGFAQSQSSVAKDSTLSVPQYPVPQFEDISVAAGLTGRNVSSVDEYSIVESMSGGAGFIDCDNDGKLDIVTVTGSTVERYRNGGDLMVTLYHQDAGLKFTDITKSAGLGRKGWGMGLSV